MKNIYIPVGSVTGTALAVAQTVKSELATQGYNAHVDESPTVMALTGQPWDALLVCTSTTGSGDVPANILPFYVSLEQEFPLLTGMPFGVIALGDSSYDTTFCHAGALFEERLLELQAVQVIPMVTIDATETVTPDQDALFWLKEWCEKTLA